MRFARCAIFSIAARPHCRLSLFLRCRRHPAVPSRAFLPRRPPLTVRRDSSRSSRPGLTERKTPPGSGSLLFPTCTTPPAGAGKPFPAGTTRPARAERHFPFGNTSPARAGAHFPFGKCQPAGGVSDFPSEKGEFPTELRREDAEKRQPSRRSCISAKNGFRTPEPITKTKNRKNQNHALQALAQ